MGVERAPIQNAFRNCMVGPPVVINHAIELLARAGSGSFTVTDDRTKLWMSNKTKAELEQLIRKEKL